MPRPMMRASVQVWRGPVKSLQAAGVISGNVNVVGYWLRHLNFLAIHAAMLCHGCRRSSSRPPCATRAQCPACLLSHHPPLTHPTLPPGPLQKVPFSVYDVAAPTDVAIPFYGGMWWVFRKGPPATTCSHCRFQLAVSPS